MAGKKKPSKPRMPRAPDKRPYHQAELLCVAVALKINLDGIPLPHLGPHVYQEVYRLACAHLAATADASLYHEVLNSNWSFAIAATIGHRLGINGLGMLMRRPNAKRYRERDAKQLAKLANMKLRFVKMENYEGG